MLSLASQMIRRMSTNVVVSGRSLVAVCQMTSDNDLNANYDVAKGFIERARERNCKMVFFPECFDFVGRTKEEQVTLAMEENSELIGRYRKLAKENNVWLSLGGFHNKDGNGMPFNSHLIINSNGETAARYDKLHLFDLEIPGKVRLMESEFSKAGEKMVPPVETPVGKVALSICYDLRFPEMSIWNRKRGAQILTFPAAFTLNTGLAHWELLFPQRLRFPFSTLLRARAIENQCYVIAAAQTGTHNEKRQSYGHAMIIDPWGAVVAQCSERVDMAFAEIDLSYVDQLRTMQPVYAHRRSDLYSVHVNEETQANEPLLFSTHPISASSIFHRTAHSFAFVNLKPVLSGHVLVSPIRVVERLTDLTDEETADLFVLAKKVQKMLESVHEVNSSTVCVQDGPHSGRTVEHVHVHILPRREGDFGGSTDTVYKELAKHDHDDRKPRSMEEMAEEAKKYRAALKSF